MKMHRVRVKQVRAHDHPRVSQRQEKLVPFVQLDGGGGDLRMQNTCVHRILRRRSSQITEAEHVLQASIAHVGETVAGT